MHSAGIVFFGLIAIFWLTFGLQTVFGVMQLPWLTSFEPAKDSDCPRISLIFSALDEAERLPAALATLMSLDYPNLEIITVNDRSQDGTPGILDEFAATHPRLKVVHIKDLPPGWLGKPHALQKAYESSTGEWLLFTDADVSFRPDTLRRCATLIRLLKLDHLALFIGMEMVRILGKGAHLLFRHVLQSGNSTAPGQQSQFSRLCRRRCISDGEAYRLRSLWYTPPPGL